MEKDVGVITKHIALSPDALEAMLSLSYHHVKSLHSTMPMYERADDIAQNYSDINQHLMGGIAPEIQLALGLLNKRWTWLILCTLMKGNCRFLQLATMVPQISNTMLTIRLNELRDMGIVMRCLGGTNPAHFEYKLTKKGQALRSVVEQLQQWAQEWM